MTRALVVAVALLAAAPAFADPLVKCVVGCDHAKVGAPTGPVKAAGDTQISDVLWFGPSLGLALFARDNANPTRSWESGILLSFSYGLKWRPSWSPTGSFLALDIGLGAGSISALTSSTPATFDITVPITLTVMDILAVGWGPRFHLGTGSTPDSVSGVLFLGLSTSFGSPSL